MTASPTTRTELSKLTRVVVLLHKAQSFSRNFADSEALANQALESRRREVNTHVIPGAEYNRFYRVLNKLRAEPETEHLSKPALEKHLHEFVLDLEEHREQYRDKTDRLEASDGFLTRITRPWQEFQVAWRLDHLEVGEVSLQLESVTICPFTPARVDEWSRPFPDDAISELLGKPVALTAVRAGDHNNASTRAGQQIDEALDVLRYSIVVERPHFMDNEFRFTRGDFHLVRSSTEPKSVTCCWGPGDRPSTNEISSDMARDLARLLSESASVNAKLDFEFQRRIRRAFRSVGASAARTSFDDKIIGLCTAFEAVAASDEHLKGEVLALRALLLALTVGEPLVDTVRLYQLYELRSELVHGANIDLCTEYDYTFLRSMAIMFIRQLRKLLSNQPDIRTYEQFISTITTEPHLSTAIDWFRFRGGPARDILELALAEQRRLYPETA